MTKVKEVSVEAIEVVIEKQLGRPVNPNSARQLRLKELAEKRANGELRRGRPVDENSARQQKLANKAEGNGMRGRPGRSEFSSSIEIS
jgi:hypothetical protein